MHDVSFTLRISDDLNKALVAEAARLSLERRRTVVRSELVREYLSAGLVRSEKNRQRRGKRAG